MSCNSATQDRGEMLSKFPLPPKFAHIRRLWDKERGMSVARLLPGEYYVTSHDELIFTVLGSCVSACVRERELGIGGMNHFLLPTDRSRHPIALPDRSVDCGRYGDVAMDRLVSGILECGGRRENLEFKVVGGAKVLDATIDVGARNAQFVLEYLNAGKYQILAEDLGDCYARKVYYSPATGRLRVKRLVATVNQVIFERECQSAPRIETGSAK